MPQAVQSDVRVAKKSPPPCEFVVGQRVRLSYDTESELYMMVSRYGFHSQIIYYEVQSVVKALKYGAIITKINVLENYVPVVDSASAEDCWYSLGFSVIGGFENWLHFPAWQFEAVEE